MEQNTENELRRNLMKATAENKTLRRQVAEANNVVTICRSALQATGSSEGFVRDAITRIDTYVEETISEAFSDDDEVADDFAG